MQIVDNLLAAHNIDQKSSLLFDINLAEYSIPICEENLDVDTQFVDEKYHSDQFMKEEIERMEGGKDQENSSQSKEYFEINF